MIPKRDKRTLRQLSDFYWSEYWDTFPHYVHDFLYSNPLAKRTGLPYDRKLKKDFFYPKEYACYRRMPSDWNKLFHRRPFRRHSKHMTDQSYVRCSGTENIEYWAYLAEERFKPNYKRTIYYY
jgi:hypothetical protein